MAEQTIESNHIERVNDNIPNKKKSCGNCFGRFKRLVSRLKFWKSNRNQVRKESIIENDINQLDEKESPNASYLRGHFGTNLFIAKVNSSEVLAPLYRENHFNEELSIANELINGTLKNENLVTICKAIIERDNVSIFLDNYSKTGTQLIMENGPQSESLSKQIIKRILRALKYLHSNGMAHRNITLDHIYISGNDDKFEAKLADFTTAVQCNKVGKTIKDKTLVGTYEYMSPETLKQVFHNPQISDIWSLGVCLFVILHDCYPFRSGDQIRTDNGRKSMIKRQLLRKYLIPKSIDLSFDCVRTYRQLMTPYPRARPTAIQALSHAWIKN